MIPEPIFIKIDKKYARMLHSLPMEAKAIIFDRLLEWHLQEEEQTLIEDQTLDAIFGLLTLDFE